MNSILPSVTTLTAGARPARPNVSVVMVVYRTGEALVESIRHVLAEPLVDEFVIIDNAVFRAIKAATPGPYTFILPATKEVPRRLMHPKKKTVGVRIPEHPVVRELLAELGEPLLSSTLILPGESEPMSEGWLVKDELDHQVDLVIDSGECGTEPTTVVDFSDGQAEVVRIGAGDAGRF